MKIGPFTTVLTLLISLASASGAMVEEMAFINGKTIPLFVDQAAGLIIDRYCHKTRGKFDCQAVKALEKASLRDVIIDGGANPGAVVCLKLGGQVVLSVDVKKNETSYCQFKDGSLVANGSITFHARKNDKE
ncbi:MAG: hypothetical protein A2X86_16295 [Bdellovibrionales bacterium GWA2_49_15]|nr:MAG: hypothetical protein A2X86_16295 [Bdellovibrionales bacterium GWA2_49_15]HAZ13667.1 hypothetical protein [Bdellovibrionales bacterium]